MFTDKLLRWYAEWGRSLPWRKTDNPYHIWLSEIILQQTRIEQGLSYYEHFVETYPTVKHLADASEEQVLKSWQGLGYYSRARNLHAAAQHIAYTLGGKFPDNYEGILSLKGVGRYTAAAIASFAFKLPYPVIDGNVYRFISRLYGIRTPIATNSAYTEFEQLLKRLISQDSPDLFNQALMDFGSTHCKPKNPDCDTCPFAKECVALRDNTVDLLPVKKPPVAVAQRYFYYFDIEWQQDGETFTLMHQRTGKDIWHGLYEFPLMETERELAADSKEPQAFLIGLFGHAPVEAAHAASMRHQLSHRTINAHFIRAKFSTAPLSLKSDMIVLRREETKNLPISRLIDRYLSRK